MKPNLIKTDPFIAKTVVAFVWFALTCLWSANSLLHGQVISAPAFDCQSCNGSAQFTTSLSGDVTYTWTDVDGNVILIDITDTGSSSLIDLCSGNYLVQATDGVNNDSSYFNVGSDQTPLDPLAEINICSTDFPFELFDEIPGSEIGGQWIDPQGNPATGTYSPGQGGAGVYEYTVDEGGCSVYTAVVVNENEPADAGLSTTYLICENYSPFFLTDFLAGSPDYGGQWFNSSFETLDGFFDPATMDTELFTYMIDTVPGCPAEFSTMFIIENFLPNPGLESEVEVCPNAVPFDMTGFLDGGPDIGGQWYDENNFPISSTYDPLAQDEGTYTYTVPGDTPCPSLSSTLTITYTDGIDAGEDGMLETCTSFAEVDLFTLLGGTPTPNGTWTGPQGDLPGGIYDPSINVEGNYTYTVTAVGCQPVMSQVVVDLETQLDAGPNESLALCETQGQVNLISILGAGVSPGGQWLDINSTIIDPLVLLEGGVTEYYYYYLDGQFCPDSQSQYSVIADEAPPSSIDNTFVFCDIDAVYDLADDVADPGAFNFSWENQFGDPVNPVLNPLIDQSGTFIYTVFSGNSCPDQITQLDVVIESMAFPNTIVPEDVCSSEGIVDLTELIPDEAQFNGTWFDTNNDIFSGSINAENAESGNYTFIVDNGSACPPSIAELQLELFEQAEAGPSQNVDICEEAEIFNLNDYLESDDIDLGSWSFAGNPIDNTFDPSISDPGVYTFEIPGMGPCPSSTALLDIFVAEAVLAEAGNDFADCVEIQDYILGGEANSGVSYEWIPADFLDNPNGANPSFSAQNAGDSVIELSYNLIVSNGVCTDEDIVTLTIYPEPAADAGENVEVCLDDEIQLNGSGGVEYSWFPPVWFEDAEVQNPTLIGIESGTVLLTVWNEWGCEATDELTVEVLPLPFVEMDISDLEGCSPLTVDLSNLSPQQDSVIYEWVVDGNAAGLEDQLQVTLETPGEHQIILVAVANNGCMAIAEGESSVTVHPLPLASFDMEIDELSVLNPRVEFTNESIDAISQVWDFSGIGSSTDEHPEFVFPATPDMGYRICLEVENEFGCVDTTCRELFIPGEFWIYAPNAFTPDYDGINDVFLPILRGIDPSDYQFSIFNRWGEQIFNTTTPDQPWIGNHQGSGYYVPNGVYIWRVEVKDLYGPEILILTGHVTIIR